MGTNTPAEVKLFLWSVGLVIIVLLAKGVLIILERRKPRRVQRGGMRRSARHKPVQRLSGASHEGDYREIALDLLNQLEEKEAELAAVKGAQPAEQTGDDWLDRLVRALHLLFIGHTGGGKTTLVHWLATTRAASGQRVIVCDPDAAPGLWSGCEVHGYGNDFAAINRALKVVAQEVERRRKLRGSGQQRIFTPLHLVIDEYQDTATHCPLAQELVEDVLRRGRKLGVHLVIGVQDKLVKTMGFEGKGDLRKNFSYVVELRKDRGDQRWATLTATGDDQGVTYPVPTLPDPESLIEKASLLSNILKDEQTTRQPVESVEHTIPYRYDGLENRPKTANSASPYRYGMSGMEHISAVLPVDNRTSTGMEDTGRLSTDSTGGGSIEERVKALHSEGWSPSKIAMSSGLVKGEKGKRLEQVKAILGLEG